MIVHQIWIGTMPAEERRWVEGVRHAALDAGWEHRLWDWEALVREFGEEPVARVFRRGFELPGEIISPVVVASLAVDYYRSKVLAVYGGVYLDCDFESRGAWPDFGALLAEQDAEVLGLEEFFAPVMCAGFFAAADGRAMRLATAAAEEYLLRVLPPDAGDFAARLVEEARRDGGRGGLAQRGVGPGWRRRVVLPLWQREGVRWGFVARAVVGHRQWGGGSALVHMGAARWHEVEGTAALGRLWRARAAAASAAGGEGAEERVPLWQRPLCSRVLPVVLRSESAPPVLTVPKGVRRVVIVSNVPGARPGEVLQPGDLCVHVNRAGHFSEVRTVPGVEHALVVRRGREVGSGSGRMVWYEPVGGVAGFTQVIRAVGFGRCRWWADYCRANPGLCPTTGFICWHLAREAAPGLPVVLVGFAPGKDVGTYRWPGHAWEYEERVYKQAGANILPPIKENSYETGN